GAALRDAVAALGELDDAIAQHDAHREHGAMVRLARVLLAEYAALKRRQGLVDMADLELVALRLLSDPVLSGWVQERLDTRLRHLLIDEFQDTSPLQWHALQSWLAGYAGAGGGREPLSVFVVGDPKQSIYRFRRAEPRVFDAARTFVVEGLGGHVLACDHTRRNAPAVLAVVNAVFEAEAAVGAFAGFRPHTTEVAGDADLPALQVLGRVERTPRERAAAAATAWRPSLRVPRHDPEDVLREREAALVAHAVQALLAEGVPAGEVFVLARKRAPLRLAAAALQARHVPFAAPEETRLVDLVEVRDLLAVLDVLASPGHDLALAQALKSPLFGASDDELLRRGGTRCSRCQPTHRPHCGARASCCRAGPRRRRRCRRTICSTASSPRATCCRGSRPRCRPSAGRSPHTLCVRCSRSRCSSTAAATRRSTASCARCGDAR
ncbi:MAG: UvrD-helicase domain-containing protein, partial [Burkholderiaceae bacterium]|nr:UvrD-helicase domain-containing protein [Burkholderiaceae bacterium]